VRTSCDRHGFSCQERHDGRVTTQPPSRDPVVPPASPPMSPLVRRTPVPPPDELPILSNRAIVWVAVVLIVLGVGLAVGLLLAVGDGRHTAQLDAIKTAGTIVLGTGGAVALWLTARRQRTSELTLKQAYAAHAATVADAEARRITDLYGKAADQLGAAQAPVRLAGLYALERLAQDNPAQRQTIVDLLCAYLRMPTEPVRHPAARREGVPRPLLSGRARQRLSVRPHVDPPAGAATAHSAIAENERAPEATAHTDQEQDRREPMSHARFLRGSGTDSSTSSTPPRACGPSHPPRPADET
jgi:hypothetical protein